MRFDKESLVSDPVHGYIGFTVARHKGEIAEETLIDHPWVQRLRRIHQLQAAWWVYPAAEHSRFPHVLGAMHLAGRAALHLDQSLREACPDETVPSPPHVESILRVAALLHDSGHGPYGHFFDSHYLEQFGLNHEMVGEHVITNELADLIRGVRTNPHGELASNETLDPLQVAFLIRRPRDAGLQHPRWLRLLRSLFCGIYTVDNMDFVLRDSLLSGHGPRAFDLDRLLHYSFFTREGLALHAKGLDALFHFVEVRSELFRTLYFHRTVRAIDLMLEDVFADTVSCLMPGPPLEHLDRYRDLTEWSLLTDAPRWVHDPDPKHAELGRRWQAILSRQITWKMACERLIRFDPGQAEPASIFTDAGLVESRIRRELPDSLRGLRFVVDIARHSHRPAGSEAARQNYVFDPAKSQTRPLIEHERFARLPVSFALCRVYVTEHDHDRELASALDRLLGTASDDMTNM
jgi:HD superfamily phosphohydrolase